MALVLPIVAVVVLGIFEAGWYMQSTLTVGEIASEAGRSLAVHGAAPEGDHLVLADVSRVLAGNKSENVQRIIIFRADGPDDQPSAACRTGAVPLTSSDECSVYLPADLALPAASLSCGWCPADRTAGERIGIMIAYEYKSITGLLGTLIVEDTEVLQLERGVEP